MSQLPGPPHPEPDSPPPSSRHWPSTLLKIGAGAGGVAILGGIAGVIWGGRLVNQGVMPRVEQTIADTIGRPVELGDLEHLSLQGVEIGATTIPPTATDASSVTVDAIDVGIDWRALFFQQTLKPSITLLHPVVSLVQAQDGQWVELKLPEPTGEKPLITVELGSIQVQNATLIAATLRQDPEAVVPRTPVQVEGVDVNAVFHGEDSKQVTFGLSGQVETGRFEIDGEGDLVQSAVKARVLTQNLPTTGVNLVLPPTLGLAAGGLDSNLTLAAALTEAGDLDQDSLNLQGTARFREGRVLVSQVSQPVTDIHSQLRFKGQQVTLEDTGLRLGKVALTAQGTVDLQQGYDLTAQIPQITLADVQSLAQVELPVPATGAFQLTTQVSGELAAPQIQGRLVNLGPVQVDRIDLATVTADFALTQQAFDLAELRLVPQSGGVILARGQADLQDLTNPALNFTARVDLPGDDLAAVYDVALPNQQKIGTLLANAEVGGTLQQPNALLQWQLTDSSFPGQGQVALAGNTLTADHTTLQVAGGTVTATALAQLDSGAWQANLTTEQVPIQQFSPQAQGLLSADLRASGNLKQLNLAAIQSEGTATVADARVQLTPTSDPLLPQGDWDTAFQWQGDRIYVERFTAPGLRADGTIGVDLSQPIPIGDLALNVSLQQFDLQPLNSLAPATVQSYGHLAGLTRFDGTLTGSLENPQLQGTAQLEDLALNQIAFQPLVGPVDFSLAEGGSMDLRGGQDRIQLTIDERLWPVSFEVRNRDFVASGHGEGTRLYANIDHFPLAQLDLQPAADYGLGPVTGTLNASLTADLADLTNPSAQGRVTITDPALDYIQARQIQARFSYADHTANLDRGELQLEHSLYQLAGKVALGSEPQFQGELTIAQGRIEDLLAALQWVNFSDIGFDRAITAGAGAADLATQPVGLPSGSFLVQLESFIAFLDQQSSQIAASQGTLAIPPLGDLTGGFTGQIQVAGTGFAPQDITADFELQGDGWQWGPYQPPNQFHLSGEYAQANLNLNPSVIKVGDTLISLSGDGNQAQLAGQLAVEHLPVALVETIAPLPVTVAGEVTLMANLSGTLANPSLVGNLAVVGAQIDQQPLNQVGLNFQYRNASLNFDGAIAANPDDHPITLQGQIPYALPFMAVQPTTDRLAIEARADSDSFKLVNVITGNQVRWEGGDGTVTVQVGGTLAQPAVAGEASFQNGSVGTTALAQPLTDLNGNLQFNLQRLGVNQLQAQLGEGSLEVAGQLPWLASGESLLSLVKTQQKTPSPASGEGSTAGLVITLNQLPIDYKGMVAAEFDGQVGITGALLQPTIGGSIAIDNGQIKANELLSQAGAINLPTEAEAAAVNPYRAEYFGTDPLAPKPPQPAPSLLNQVTLQNFTVGFKDRLVIAGQPFYNLTAVGGLTVNGTLSHLQPDGTIKLSSGWINLFSTQFRLDQGAANTATFTPEKGLDPFVDVVLKARVQEADITPVPPSAGGFTSAEVSDTSDLTSVGDVRFINVEARAYGPASQLNDNLTLTSNPSRSEQDLIALIGSNVIGGLSAASLTQVAGFLGSGALAGFGNNLADTVGLQSFSVFPTTDTATDSTAGIGIGVEAAFGIGSNIGINLLEILNSGNPPQIGLQYRFSDHLQLRGSTNLSGNNQVLLEYETDF